MAVDVRSVIDIDLPRSEVAAFAADPDNAPRWYSNIKAVTWRSARPLHVGSRMEFVAEFLGRRLVYTYEVEQMVPGERLVMATTEGPFPMRTTYAWTDAAAGGTAMELRNEGPARGLQVDRRTVDDDGDEAENRKDLRRLKEILEAR